MNKFKFISIIIVHYKNKVDLLECLNTLYKFKPKYSFEVIIVDNSEKKEVQKQLLKYKDLKYVPSAKNLGYGAGMNLGASYAKGEYLFILNPDVLFEKDIISPLLQKIKSNLKIGIIAPILYSTDGKVLEQGAEEITPLRALVKFSFIDKIWKNNPISKNYWVRKWNINKLQQVDNVPGTAFIIKKEIFEEVKGFDENFFLYFEEFDLCKRVRFLGYKIFIDPSEKLIHKWGTTTKLLKNKDEIFKQSRSYYFKKHFGLLKALFIDSFLSLNKYSLIFILILITSFLARLYQISSSLGFIIGDQGWFYLSARDMLLSGKIPLVGITSSHLWLHQGPFWTYILGIIFFIFNFNPLAPPILSVLLDALTLILIYKLIGRIFTKKTALFASLIYAFSPYVILSTHMPYHTTPIPFFMILFTYSLFKWLSGSSKYFPFLILVLSVLYNFELQTSLLFILIFIILIYGFIKKTLWFKNIANKKIISYSLLTFCVVMLPIIIYDIGHGFPQTIVFAGWIVFKALSFLPHLFMGGGELKGDYVSLVSYFYLFFKNLIYVQSGIISLGVVLISLGFLIFKNINDYLNKRINIKYCLILILTLFIFSGILVSKTPSDAYLYSLIIPLVLVVSIFLGEISKNNKVFLFILLFIVLTSILNVYTTLTTNYNFKKPIVDAGLYSNRLDVAKYLVKDSRGESFRMVGIGPGSQFKSFTDGYEYLSWYLGGNPEKNGKHTYILYEKPNGIKIIKKD